MSKKICLVLAIFFGIELLLWIPSASAAGFEAKQPRCGGDYGITVNNFKGAFCTGMPAGVACSYSCCREGTRSPVPFTNKSGSVDRNICSYEGITALSALELSPADYQTLLNSGFLITPNDCSQYPNYTYSPNEATENKCIPNSYDPPTNCNQYGQSGMMLPGTTCCVEGSSASCLAAVSCITDPVSPCSAVEACDKSKITPRAPGLGNNCFLGYINSCNSPYYNYTQKFGGNGYTCQIDTSKIPGAIKTFASTNFEGDCGQGYVDTAVGCVPIGSLNDTMAFVLKWVFLAAGGIIVALIIKNGFTLLTSSGNPEKLKEVRESVISLVSGILLIIFSLTILKIVGADILGLPGF